MTITRAKGEGNGHFYHIEVIDLPFHTIPFVSCFISLIENTKNDLLLKIYKQIWDNLRASKFTGQSIFSFAYYTVFGTTLALMRRCVRSQELCARTMTMEDAYQVKITLQSRAPNVDSNSLTYFWFNCTAHAALCATHIGFMCIMTQNGRVTHGPWNSWWNYIMIMKMVHKWLMVDREMVRDFAWGERLMFYSTRRSPGGGGGAKPSWIEHQSFTECEILYHCTDQNH